MKRTAITATLGCLLLALPAAGPAALPAEAAERVFSWVELAAAEQLRSGRLASDPSEGRVLELTGQPGRAVTLPLLVVEDPAIVGDRFSVRGRLRFDDVGDGGYLEMYSVFAGGERYFSRTSADHGPLARLSGSSGWRQFELPFSMAGTEQRPEALELNLFLPSGGTVYLSNLTLRDWAPPAGAIGGWWSRASGNLLGAILGAGGGTIFGILGVLSTKPRFFGLVISAGRIALLLAVTLAVGCAVAWFQGQPYHVVYPLGLLAVILGPVSMAMVFQVKRRRLHHELRAMRSTDLV